MLNCGITLRNAILQKQTNVKLFMIVILAIFHSHTYLNVLKLYSDVRGRRSLKKLLKCLGTRQNTTFFR